MIATTKVFLSTLFKEPYYSNNNFKQNFISKFYVVLTSVTNGTFGWYGNEDILSTRGLIESSRSEFCMQVWSGSILRISVIMSLESFGSSMSGI